MTANLLASLIRMSLYLFAPWILFSKKEKTEESAAKKEDKSKATDIPVHEISWKAEEETSGLTLQLTEVCAVVTELCGLAWLIIAQHYRSVCERLSYLIKPKAPMDDSAADLLQDFDTEELKLIEENAESSLALHAVLNGASPASKRVQQAVPNLHLLHFAALVDDLAASKCLKKLGSMYDPTGKHSFLGPAEKEDWNDAPWEKRITKHRPGVKFSLERKYLRKGLYAYRSTAVFMYASMEDFKKFILDLDERSEWDWSAVRLLQLQTASEAAELPPNSECIFFFTENKMPGPLANREYVAARRVWHRADGGCYSLMKAFPHPSAPKTKKRNVRVDDYASGFVLRPLSSVDGEKMQAVEMTSLYFDDAKMRPMAYNLAMNASMWTGITLTESAFRKYMDKIYPPQEIQNTEDLEVENEPIQEVARQRPRHLCSIALISVFVAAAIFGKGQGCQRANRRLQA